MQADASDGFILVPHIDDGNIACARAFQQIAQRAEKCCATRRFEPRDQLPLDVDDEKCYRHAAGFDAAATIASEGLTPAVQRLRRRSNADAA